MDVNRKQYQKEKLCLSCLPFRLHIGTNGGFDCKTLQPNLSKALVITFSSSKSVNTVHTILYETGHETILFMTESLQTAPLLSFRKLSTEAEPGGGLRGLQPPLWEVFKLVWLLMSIPFSYQK